MKFVYKVSFAGSIVGFVDICSDGSRASYDLINKNTLPLRVSTSSQTAIICRASAFALVRSSESFIVFLLLVLGEVFAPQK